MKPFTHSKKITFVTHPLSLTLIIEPGGEPTTQSAFKRLALKITVGGQNFPVALKHAIMVVVSAFSLAVT